MASTLYLTRVLCESCARGKLPKNLCSKVSLLNTVRPDHKMRNQLEFIFYGARFQPCECNHRPFSADDFFAIRNERIFPAAAAWQRPEKQAGPCACRARDSLQGPNP